MRLEYASEWCLGGPPLRGRFFTNIVIFRHFLTFFGFSSKTAMSTYDIYIFLESADGAEHLSINYFENHDFTHFQFGHTKYNIKCIFYQKY